MEKGLKRFENKIVLVIGGGGGMGSMTVRRLAEEGATVISADMFPEKGQPVVDEVVAKGGKAEFMVCQANKEEEVKALLDNIVAKYGRLDAAINNMGGEVPSPMVIETTEQRHREIMDSNLTSFFFAIKHEGQVMKKQGFGAIVSICSINHFVLQPMLGHYCASKAGFLALSKNMAMEIAPFGVRVNTVSPGYTLSPPVARNLKGNLDQIGAVLFKIPTRKFNMPEDIAAASLFLISDDARNINAHDLVVDGGLNLEGYPDSFEIRNGLPTSYIPSDEYLKETGLL